jgi:hypothetical protein
MLWRRFFLSLMIVRVVSLEALLFPVLSLFIGSRRLVLHQRVLAPPWLCQGL